MPVYSRDTGVERWLQPVKLPKRSPPFPAFSLTKYLDYKKLVLLYVVESTRWTYIYTVELFPCAILVQSTFTMSSRQMLFFIFWFIKTFFFASAGYAQTRSDESMADDAIYILLFSESSMSIFYSRILYLIDTRKVNKYDKTGQEITKIQLYRKQHVKQTKQLYKGISKWWRVVR